MTIKTSMTKREKSIAEKLNKLTDINTFWNDVRNMTMKVTTTAACRDWEFMSEQRYAEILTGVEDVQTEVEYGQPTRYYDPNSNWKEVFPIQ